MAEGRIYVPYVPVEGDTTNRLRAANSLARSGGQTQGGYFILWTTQGITNTKWTYIQNYLPYTGWETVASELNVAATYENFVSYVKGSLPNVSAPENLDEVFGPWSNKTDFVILHGADLGIRNTNPNSPFYRDDGCIQEL